jgi:signal transduction histidine kinase
MSLRARLTLAQLALLAFCLSAFGFGVYTYVDTELHDQFEASLKSRGDSMLPLLSTVPSRLEDVRPVMETFRPAGDTFTVMVEETTPQKAILYKTESLVRSALPDVPTGRVVNVSTPQGPLSLYSLDFSVPDRDQLKLLRDAGEPAKPDGKAKPLFTGRITVARSPGDINASLRLLRTILVGGGSAALAVATVLGLGLSTTLLRPLERMRAAAQRIGDERDFHLRLPVDHPRHELGRLSESVNEMLGELEHAHGSLQATLDVQRRFVGDASHELRTPVTAIRTNAEFLRRAPDAREEDRSEALADVLIEVQRMEQLVGDLLALARLESTEPPVHSPLRLDHLLIDVQRDGVRSAPEGVEVSLERTSELWVSGEREDLRRAIANLVENAVKYSRPGVGRRGREGPERVILACEKRGDTAVVTVRDTGIGIAREDLPFVFERFWRAPEVRGTPGSGLGLAITRWVAQSHGGSIQVRSVRGRGTTFLLRLPVVGAPPGPRPVRADASAGSVRKEPEAAK